MFINNQVSVQQQRQGGYPQLLYVVFVFSIAITVAVTCWLIDLRTTKIHKAHSIMMFNFRSGFLLNLYLAFLWLNLLNLIHPNASQEGF